MNMITHGNIWTLLIGLLLLSAICGSAYALPTENPVLLQKTESPILKTVSVAPVSSGVQAVAPIVSEQKKIIYEAVSPAPQTSFGNTSLNGTLSVSSTPTGSVVLLDGKVAGTTAFLKQVQPGIHVLTVHKEGYADVTKSVTVSGSGRTTVGLVTLTLLPADYGQIYVASYPSGASVSLDGTVSGTTPVTIPAQAGYHTLILNKTGYQNYRLSVPVTAGKTTSVGIVKLVPINGSLSVYSNPLGAQVFLNEKFVGNTTLYLSSVKAGSYSMKVNKTGYQDYKTKILISPGKLTTVGPVILKPKTPYPGTGTLFVTSYPIAASVCLDGKSVGITPLYLEKVGAGEHQVNVTKDGYSDYQKKINVTAGVTTNVIVTLTPKYGSLSVTTYPAGASIFINDDFCGYSPVKMEGMTPGSYTVNAAFEGYIEETKTIQVFAGQESFVYMLLDPDSSRAAAQKA